MKGSFDVKALLSEAMDLKKAQQTVVTVHLVIDESATPQFQAFMRSGFMSDALNARLVISYIPTQMPDLLPADIVVIAAGASDVIPDLKALFSEAGLPVLVVQDPQLDTSSNQPEEGAEKDSHLAKQQASSAQPNQPDEQGLPELDASTQEALADDIGRWIVQAVPEKRLAFSIAYPFVRRPLAHEAISATAIQNAGVGLVVFIPGADMPVMTLNQAKMILQIAAAYGQPLSADRVKELAATFASALVFRGISRQLVALVPALGWAIKAAMGYAGTKAIGNAAIEYFEKGGSIAGLASVISKVQHKLVNTCASVKDHHSPEDIVHSVERGAATLACEALDQVEPLVRSVAHTTSSSLNAKGIRKIREARAQK